MSVDLSGFDPLAKGPGALLLQMSAYGTKQTWIPTLKHVRFRGQSGHP